VTGNPVTFTAQAATKIVVTSAPTPQTLASVIISVQLQDAANAAVPLAGVPLTISIATGGGTLGGTATVSTNSSGAATFTLSVTGTAGARTFTITGAGLTSATTISITLN
jgi:lipoprotein-anchoring transpeptidase ErfK/SrfK